MARGRRKARSNALRLAFLVLILAVVYLLLQQTGQKAPEKPPVAGLHAIEVIDGDTFRDSDGETIRLLGVDTPEKGEPFCAEATYALDSLMSGRRLRYEFDRRKRDKYGRLLAYVFTDECFINRKLVEMGLARVYIFPKDMKNHDYRALLIEDQNFARMDSLRIWSLPGPQTEEYYVGNKNTYRFHRPYCFSAENLDTQHIIIKRSRDEFLDMGFSPCRNCNP